MFEAERESRKEIGIWYIISIMVVGCVNHNVFYDVLSQRMSE